MLPFREVFFNIDQHGLFYAMAALATAVFVYGLVRRWRFWASGWGHRRGRVSQGGQARAGAAGEGHHPG